MKKFGYALMGMMAPAVTWAFDEGVTPVDPGPIEVGEIVMSVVTWVLGFAAAIAVLFIIIGGILYITSAGNKDRAESAKKTLLYAIIGLIVIVLSYVIVAVVQGGFDAII